MNNTFSFSGDTLVAPADDVLVHYRRAGQGQPLLLLHGSGSSLDGMAALTAQLSSSYDVISVDLPGFARTGPRPDGDYRVATYVTTLVGFLDALGIERVTVVGNSFGGNLAWNLALDHPDRVDRLVLINATGYPDKTLPIGMQLMRLPVLRTLIRLWMPRQMIAKNLEKTVGPTSTIVDDAMVDRAYRLMNLPGNRAAFVDFVNTEQRDRSGEIRRITAPTLILRSASIDGQYFGRDIAGSEEAVHPNGGHLLPEEEPTWVAQNITEFLPSQH
ncbi:alpha/beta fold hydrolase [Antrihabitans stalactiti]|uniref:Alpha/beta hydrolase n=1 Tax=Antrihabitans stalactiti TaxID=2584121 RepID=A0A848KBI1_9NOCA|nr:alpha/beta hydrolase [Antrihabitans stalactiti]NMN95669.1 alpha/beta hydrolase [Antrihabitans stalactiti]